jgi:RNA polymerase sigma-70 factor (ECF subfamily)
MTSSPQKKISKITLNKIKSDMTEASLSHQKDLSKHALYKTNNIDLSNDLVQSTFLKALLYLQKGGKIDTMRIFLNHIMHDLIVDEYRKRKTTSLDTLLQLGFDPSFDDTQRNMNILDGRKIVLLIDKLPMKYQEIMRMRYLQDLSPTEIAKLTGQSKNTVAVQSYRGLKKLKVLVANDQKKLIVTTLR